MKRIEKWYKSYEEEEAIAYAKKKKLRISHVPNGPLGMDYLVYDRLNAYHRQRFNEQIRVKNQWRYFSCEDKWRDVIHRDEASYAPYVQTDHDNIQLYVNPSSEIDNRLIWKEGPDHG